MDLSKAHGCVNNGLIIPKLETYAVICGDNSLRLIIFPKTGKGKSWLVVK